MSTTQEQDPRITGAPAASQPTRVGYRDVGGPSVLQDDQPTASRILAMVALGFLIFGGMALGFHAVGGGARVPQGWAILLVIGGVAGLLFHAAFDADVQIRRVYMAVGVGVLVLGVALCFIPYPNKMGDQFRLAVPCLLVGLLFVMSFLRNEDDPGMRDLSQKVVGAVGLGLGLVGLLVGMFNQNFFLPMGLILGVLGLIYVTAFVGTRGIGDDLGYLGALLLCAIGALVIVVALGRWLIPQDGYRYFVNSGLLFLVVGLFYVAVGAGLALDWPILVLTRRELSSFFLSPIAYLTLLGFTVISYGSYVMFISRLYETAGPMARAQPMVEPIIASYFFELFPVFVNVFLPSVLTMRLLSEEQRSGTLEVLLTAPVDEVTVVLSKFFAGLISFLIMWIPFGLYLVTIPLAGGTPFDYRPLLSFCITLVATGAGFIGMGLFFSSLTKSQVASGVLTLAGMLLLTLVYFLQRIFEGEGARKVLMHISYLHLWLETVEGKIMLRYLLFFPSLAVLSVFLTIKVLESRKWR